MKKYEKLLEYPLKPRKKYPLALNIYIIVYQIRYTVGYFFLPSYYKHILDTYNTLSWQGIIEERDKIKEIARTWR